ncbi:hypothetical protein [Amycolatopsis sp. CA-230715]|uniref:hypothetical protein n=1 Tax=Amycolatopsis sp. CA-230715 TaxID=2745196 RepID=UPI001C029CF1|nr:hypothetical protein [Amycolatopsis sp. CA-230715]QWF81151.1 hypothetical protein HUW46_04577 [Amycolatopsis sp. CA-230715]
MSAPTDDRTYIRVHDGIEDHPKIVALSDKAFRLLITTWAWCSKHRTDGRVPAAVWRKRGTAKARAELVTAGLVDGGADAPEMHDYLQHQRSAAEIALRVEAKRAGGRIGNHIRWHVARGVVDRQCEHCNDDPPPPPQRGPHRSDIRSHQRSQHDRKPSPEAETETEAEKGGGNVATLRAVADGASEQPPTPASLPAKSRPPSRCTHHANDDRPPPCGRCADARRAAERHDAEQGEHQAAVTAALAAARADPAQRCAHGTDGGLFRRPDTGALVCALCRRAERHAS